MRKYIHVAEKIYRGLWLIKPETLESIRDQFENHIKYGAQMPMDDMEEDEEETMEVSAGTAVISIDGILGRRLSMMESLCGGVDTEAIAAQLKSARDNPDVKNIILEIASPGGTVGGIPELANLINEVDATKPIYSYVPTLAASAAYWLASQTRAIFANPSAEVGSVGCYSLMVDASRAYEKEGIKIDPIVSKGSPMKLAGADFKPLSDEERAYFQTSVDKIYNQFTTAILSKRKVDPAVMDGRVFDGEDSVNNNLIDGVVSSLEDVLSLINGVDKQQ